MRFGPDYREEISLRGETVVLRPIRPGDREQLRRGLARLSEASRYKRFFTPRERLSERELTYLTEVDGWDHFALVAGIEREDGGEEGLGVARFVRDPADPTAAEPAVAVVDAWQGRGLGTLLLERLSEAARERGVHQFTADFLAINEPVRGMLARLSSRVAYRADGGVVHAVVPLDEAPILHRETERPATHHLFAEIASGRVTLREGLRLLKRSER